MADRSGIEWTDASWTPIRARNRATGRLGWHCTHVSEGCRNCYAERLNLRLGTGVAFKPAALDAVELFLDEKMLLRPLHWRRPRKIFVGATTDIFADFVPDEWLDQLFAVMALCPQHTFQVLTKRSARMRAYLTNPSAARRIYELACDIVTDLDLRVVLVAPGIDPKLAPPGPRLMLDVWPIPNVSLGISAEDQATANARIPDLLDTPAVVRWVSAEPLLGPIDFSKWVRGSYECAAECGWRSGSPPPREICHHCGLTSESFGEFCSECGHQDFGDICPACESNAVNHHPDTPCLDWIVAGGESGPNARPMHPDWVRSLRDQCAAAGVPFFFKQWGEFREFDSGSTDVELVLAETDKARTVLTLADKPSWITADGTHIRKVGDLPVEGAPGARLIERVGKKAAGRLLDGVLHDAMPAVRA